MCAEGSPSRAVTLSLARKHSPFRNEDDIHDKQTRMKHQDHLMHALPDSLPAFSRSKTFFKIISEAIVPEGSRIQGKILSVMKPETMVANARIDQQKPEIVMSN